MNGVIKGRGVLMFDKDLARRFMIRINKEVVEAFAATDNPGVRQELQRAINDLTFMYDILHLNDDIQVIDIGSNSNK